MRISPGNAPFPIRGTGTLVNSGPATVYYGDDQYVSTTSNDGSLAAGATVAIAGTMWLVGGPADVDVRGDTSAVVGTGGGGGGSGQTIITQGGVGAGAVPHAELHRKNWLPTGMLDITGAAAGDVIDMTLPDRMSGQASTAALTAGTLRLIGGLVVPAGRTVYGAGFMTSASAGTGANVSSMSLYRASDRVLLAKSADSAAAPIPANADRTQLFTTPWTATQDTPVLVGVLIVGGTMPGLSAITTAAKAHTLGTGPVDHGNADASLTGAATLPATAAAPTATTNKPLVWLTSTDAAPAADTSEGLFVSKDLASLSATDATGKVVLTAPCPIIVRDIRFVSTSALSVSDTDYWTFEFGRLRNPGNTYNAIVTKSTQATGGGAVFAMTPYSFDQVAFDTNAQVLLKDDTLVLRPTKTGAPATINTPAVTVRYQIL